MQQSDISDLIFKFNKLTYNPGEMIHKAGTSLKSLAFIELGTVEVFTEFDGHEFVIDWLRKGSALNTRTFFSENTIQVSMRALDYC